MNQLVAEIVAPTSKMLNDGYDLDGELLLSAPVSGIVVPLENVPDPVFAQKLVGPGVAIDPTAGTIYAPVSGRISQLHRAHHALTLTTAAGAEILIHVGIDTVKLNGAGFHPLVHVGQDVRSGEALLEFDADLISRWSPSLLVLMVVANLPGNTAVTCVGTEKAEARHPLVKIAKALPPGTSAAAEGPWLESEPVMVADASGMHARPAAELAALAKTFSCRVELVKGARRADVRSVTGVLALEIGAGESVSFRAQGSGAAAALKALARKLGGEPPAAAAPTPPVRVEVEVTPTPGVLGGVTSSGGISAGTIFRLLPQTLEIEEDGEGTETETARLTAALARARDELQRQVNGLTASHEATQSSIFAAHLELLEDPQLSDLAAQEIRAGRSAAYAWTFAFTTVANQLARLNNQLLAARAGDLRDVGRRVAKELVPAGDSPAAIPAGSILVAEDFLPSDVAGLDRARVHGLCTVLGGATSHVAILARSLDLPALVGMPPSLLALPNGTPVILDATRGELRTRPSPGELAAFAKAEESRAKRRREEKSRAHEPAVTRDGHKIEVAANLKGAAEAKGAVELGAEGVGLLRTEFLFLDRAAAPSEEEQFASYREIARAFGKERPLVIRTLDVGGDKPLAYLPLPKEENPFLGERGIRVSLRHPQSFRSQLRAILRAGAEANVHVMFPMVAHLGELRAAKAILEEERARLNARAVPVGVMVEVPSVALLADHFAREADFFSIGSNDLAQYTLAIDRGHPKLAGEVDGLDPSLLRLIDLAVKAAHHEKKWVGVCGGIAGDPQAVPILLGLGVDELSVSIPALPAVKAQVRRLSYVECKKLAAKALLASTAAEVRALVPLEN